MKKITILLLSLSLILAACGAQPSSLATEAAPASSSTEEVSASQPTEPPASLATEQPDPSGASIYRIVAGESTLQYEVGEVFFNENNRFNVAVGITTQINGEITVNLAEPQNSTLGPVTADISQFKSDSPRRDNALRERFIQSSRYPTVTFVANQFSGLPESYQEGQTVQLQIGGELTIRETTRPVTFAATVMVQADQLTGEATTTILMSDFGFGPIDMGGILKTEDEVKITLSFIARP